MIEEKICRVGLNIFYHLYNYPDNLKKVQFLMGFKHHAEIYEFIDLFEKKELIKKGKYKFNRTKIKITFTDKGKKLYEKIKKLKKI